MRRLAALALLVSSLAIVQPSRVSAGVSQQAEPVARKAVTSSPQTTGPGGSLSWGLDRIDQRTAVTPNRSYSFLTDGNGVNIYVLDSGVAGNHQEFGARVLDGWSYRSSSTALQSYNAALAAYNPNTQSGIEPCDNLDASHAVDPATFDNPGQPDVGDKGRTDNDGHGTHVAGIAAGDSVGVAKNANIIPVRALDSCGNGTRTMILEALAWILADHDANEKAVLNLSVGFGEQVSSVDNAVISLMNEGVLVVAAAGNSSISACNNTPASTPGTISVGSSTATDTESEFTNYGTCVDIFAPGGTSVQGGQKIVSAYPYLGGVTNTYANLVGTSMAAPFVAGALARYLQTVSIAPTSASSGMTAAWTWVSSNATMNAIAYYANRSPQTVNRLLFVPPGMPPQVSSLSAIPADGSAMVTWAGNVAGIVYTAVATPGNAVCTIDGGNACLLSGLTNGTAYTVTVTGVNSDGTGPAATTTVVPSAPETVPAASAASTTSRAVIVSWNGVTAPNATYVVTSTPPSAGCTTSSTSCVISGLTNGVNYTFSISTTFGFGIQSATSRVVEARPGFVVKKTIVTKGSRNLFSFILTTPSKGKKTWSESGPCSISRGRLVAPKRTTTCVLKLTVATSGSYPKMSTTLKVTVQ